MSISLIVKSEKEKLEDINVVPMVIIIRWVGQRTPIRSVLGVLQAMPPTHPSVVWCGGYTGVASTSDNSGVGVSVSQYLTRGIQVVVLSVCACGNQGTMWSISFFIQW